eukprot:TRINITY_DN1812_c0_g1_i1.p1 TRINITY_DN1812_c0_g1~~TRINITY_DN1812_c0_g1_i1.p1  ORF type:complete len:146 (+),score=29.53 TRINITY_DN1812_c0_g1_i1:72-509(+)
MNNQSYNDPAYQPTGFTMGNSKSQPLMQPMAQPMAQPVQAQPVFSQPMAQPVVTTFPQAQPMALGPNNTAIPLYTQVQVQQPGSGPITGRWISGVFDCFEDGETAIMSLFCGCYQFAKNVVLIVFVVLKFCRLKMLSWENLVKLC